MSDTRTAYEPECSNCNHIKDEHVNRCAGDPITLFQMDLEGKCPCRHFIPRILSGDLQLELEV